jgi:hypothetical protein
MIRTTPFHERTNALNQTDLWTHWSGDLAAFSAADAPEVTFRAQAVVGNDGFSVEDEAFATVQVTDRDISGMRGSPR